MSTPKDTPSAVAAPKVLVAAASAHGSTAEIAGTIGEVLTQRGLDVTVLPADHVTDLAPYDAVVLGSAVYAGHWLAPALEVAHRCAPARAKRGVWLFSSGPVGREGDKTRAAMNHDPAELREVRTETGARDHRMFAGRLESRSLRPWQRTMLRLFPTMAGDFRDWTEIRSWAGDIATELTTTS